MLHFNKSIAFIVSFTVIFFLLQGCGQSESQTPALKVPRGYAPVLEIEMGDRLLGFGPFVGYYFKPEIPGDLTRLKFICFNERSFYTKDVAENAEIFEGDAVLTRIADVIVEPPHANRINPIYLANAPALWIESRPDPKDEFVHFHSCYDSLGPVLIGYWLRHKGAAAFTYDMGGRIGSDSPLYHNVKPGIDKAFAQIIEFDRGPE